MRKAMLMAASILVGSAFPASRAHAQGAPYDRQVIEMQARIGEDSAKLARYKAMVDQFEKNKKSAADQAQQSADENKRAAEKLANDPQDKKLARKANRAASDAKSDAKKAREASDKLDDLNKDIKKLTKQIEKEQAKLEKYQSTAAAAPKDSTGQK
ncbi:MAG TPA: hypothetical protein VN616_08640 [Puia sp.]|nr:hypothetical protein [Puia sp.]